jgi:sodium transport system permease protein
MQATLIVFAKEILDNLRDRRSLASALIMGPIFAPVMLAFVINLSIERSLEDVELTLELPVLGQAHAPSLVRYLQSRNIAAVDGPESRVAAPVPSSVNPIMRSNGAISLPMPVSSAISLSSAT